MHDEGSASVGIHLRVLYFTSLPSCRNSPIGGAGFLQEYPALEGAPWSRPALEEAPWFFAPAFWSLGSGGLLLAVKATKAPA